MTAKQSRLDDLRTAIESRLEWAEEYETSHNDAGGNYLDCLLPDTHVRDSALLGIFGAACACQQDHSNAKTRAHSLPLARKIWESISMREIALVAEARPGHILDSDTFPDAECIASWPVGEIEVDLSDVVEEDGDLELIEQLGESEFCLRIHGDSVLGYVSTDAIWHAVLTHESCEQLIADAICQFCRR